MPKSKYVIELKIPEIPKRLNLTLRSHYHVNHREKKKWEQIIFLASRAERPKRPLTKAIITIIRYSYKMLDYDGLVGSMKPVVDALIHSKIIKDDRWSMTGKWDIDQKFRPLVQGPLLYIKIEEK